MDTERIEKRREILESLGSDSESVGALLSYNDSVYEIPPYDTISLPLDDEPHVAVWSEYYDEARDIGAFEALKKHIVQFRFPIREGIDASTEYAAAVRKGQFPESLFDNGLQLERPDQLELYLYPTIAGQVPVLVTHDRHDFESLYRAILHKSNPAPVLPSVGAVIIAGYNNWDRIHRLKDVFRNGMGALYTDAHWSSEFTRIRQTPSLFRDTFILLSDDWYSGVNPDDLGVDGTDWRARSVVIRREHECTHYITRRLFGSMRNNILDELIADAAGLIASEGQFNAESFLHFIGLENYPDYRSGGRLEHYLGDVEQGTAAFDLLKTCVARAARNVESATENRRDSMDAKSLKIRLILTLVQFTLEELAADNADDSIIEVFDSVPDFSV